MHFSKNARHCKPDANVCGAGRDRTDDIQLAKLALSQLSYSPGNLVTAKRGDWLAACHLREGRKWWA
jgi:hypothetical protein